MAIFITPATTWNNLANKPAVLSDNQISWDELINKPSSFAPSDHVHSTSLAGALSAETYGAGTTFGAAVVALVPGSAGGRLERSTQNGHYVIFLDSNDSGDSFAIVSRLGSVGTAGNPPDFLALQVTRDGVVICKNRIISPLPVFSNNLQVGSFYRDTNNFVKIVP